MIFRVKKTDNFTTISNYHIRDKRMSAKAKHYLTLMLTFNNDFEFNMQFLINNCTDGKDSVRSAINELEKFGYVRKKLNYENNLKSSYEFTVYEMPLNVMKEKPDMSYELNKISRSENPTSGKSIENEVIADVKRVSSRSENPTSSGSENPLQRNTKDIYIGEDNELDKDALKQNAFVLNGQVYMQHVQMSLKREGLSIEDAEYKINVKKFINEMIGTGEYDKPIHELKKRFYYWLRKKVEVKSGKRNDRVQPTQAVGPAYKRMFS